MSGRDWRACEANLKRPQISSDPSDPSVVGDASHELLAQTVHQWRAGIANRTQGSPGAVRTFFDPLNVRADHKIHPRIAEENTLLIAGIFCASSMVR